MRFCLSCSLLLVAALPAQIGGSGVDGAFDATSSITIDTDQKAEFSFTSLRIRQGVVVRVQGSKPILLRCRGDVWIEGELNGDGSLTPGGASPGAGGPGGYAGGKGAIPLGGGQSQGQGPCGGAAAVPLPPLLTAYGSGGQHAGCHGTTLPFTLTGGSGGGGGYTRYVSHKTGGDGGGGVIVILADGKIRIDGILTASGPPKDHPFVPNPSYGGDGAGGAILLRSLSGIQTGTASLILVESSTWYAMTALDRHRPFATRGSKIGYLRLDVENGTVDLKGTTWPAPATYKLPFQHIPIPPVLGKSWRLEVAGMPGDLAAIYWSWGLKQLNVPPFGILHLDLSKGFIFAGALGIPQTGIDPIGAATFFAYNHPALRGWTLHAQSLTLGLPTGRPRLTNASSTLIR